MVVMFMELTVRGKGRASETPVMSLRKLSPREGDYRTLTLSPSPTHTFSFSWCLSYRTAQGRGHGHLAPWGPW